MAQARSEAEEFRKDAAERMETLQQENADLKKRLELATADSQRQAQRLAAVKREAVRLQDDLDAAWLLLAELDRKQTDDRVEKAEDPKAGAGRTNLAATVAGPAVAAGEAADPGAVKRGQRNGKNNNAAVKRRRGPVASLPRTSPSFSELDTDHDGRLTLEEYKAGYPDSPDVEKEFKALDTNGDGTLSIDEYKAGHPDPPVVPIRRPKKK